MTWNLNKNAFLSSISQTRNDIHAFKTMIIPKATKTQKRDKTKLVKSLTDIIQEISTDDFGIRLLILKTLQ